MNVLISGVAGDIGVGVARILKKWGIFGKLHGIDVNPDHYASLFLDVCAESPRANDKDYLPWLTEYTSKHKINLFIPTSEAELSVLAETDVLKIGDADVLINSKFIVQTCLDKFDCLEYLSSNGVAVPKYGLVGNDVPDDFPVIVKPRSGQGSKGVLCVNTPREFEKISSGNLLWQTYLQPDDEEYTCAIFVSKAAITNKLVIRRKLVGGLTGSGEVVNNPIIDEYLSSIVKTLNLTGALNIQLRLTSEGARLFEINPRLSSTVVFRDLMGFQDLRWWTSDVLGLGISFETSLPEEGTRFFRGSKEYIFANYLKD